MPTTRSGLDRGALCGQLGSPGRPRVVISTPGRQVDGHSRGSKGGSTGRCQSVGRPETCLSTPTPPQQPVAIDASVWRTGLWMRRFTHQFVVLAELGRQQEHRGHIIHRDGIGDHRRPLFAGTFRCGAVARGALLAGTPAPPPPPPSSPPPRPPPEPSLAAASASPCCCRFY